MANTVARLANPSGGNAVGTFFMLRPLFGLSKLIAATLLGAEIQKQIGSCGSARRVKLEASNGAGFGVFRGRGRLKKCGNSAEITTDFPHSYLVFFDERN